MKRIFAVGIRVACVTIVSLHYALDTVAWAGRPLDTEDTGTLAPGKVDLELSSDYSKGSVDNLWGLKGVVIFGLLPRLEAKVESSLLWLEPEAKGVRGGIGDSALRVKYRLLEEEGSLPAVLGALTFRLPTGNTRRGLGADGTDVGLLAVVSKAFGPVTMTWNGGYTFITQDRDLDVWTLAGSIEYRLTEAWALVGEIVSALGADKEADTAVLRFGNAYAITDRIKLDGAVGFGVTRGSPDVIVAIGATISLF